jgi:hypothetical protein
MMPIRDCMDAGRQLAAQLLDRVGVALDPTIAL